MSRRSSNTNELPRDSAHGSEAVEAKTAEKDNDVSTTMSAASTSAVEHANLLGVASEERPAAEIHADTIETVNSFHQLYYDQRSRTWSNTFWLGTIVYKTPFDLWIYQELLYELKPDLLIECGTADGGSALFIASICDLIGCGHVVTVDVKAGGVEQLSRPLHPRITYMHGSSISAEVINAQRNRP